MAFDGPDGAFARLARLPPTVVDAGLGASYVLGVAAEVIGAGRAARGWAFLAVLTLVLAVSVVLRRRIPLTALAIGTTALVLESYLQVATALSPLATLIGAHSVGLYATRTRARWGVALIVSGVLGFFAFTPGLGRTDPADLVTVLLTWLAGWAFGYAIARRREDQDQARRAVELQVIAEERARMSRELHDVVGHTVNLLVVQAGAARLTMDRDPAQARALLKGMEDTGRETLADLDRVLAALRADPAEGEHSPGTTDRGLGLAQLPDLVGRFHDSGVDARLSVDPGLRLPPELDVSTYRIVQEALTNVLKHAAPCSATVTVARAPGSAVIEVCDTGSGRRQSDRFGRGLIGIAERVSLCGGVLELGDGEQGGFRLRAVLPLP